MTPSSASCEKPARLRPSASESLALTLQILGALQALHGRRLVHRDIKPSNVFLTPYGVKLLDFGLARQSSLSFAQTATALTKAGTILGTPRYMAPEQIHGQPVDARADLFAVAVMLFEMLSGVHPFSGDSELALLQAIVTEHPRRLSGSPWADEVDCIIRRALAKDPADRYLSAERLAEEPRRVLPLVKGGDAARVRTATPLAVLPFHVRPPDSETEFIAAGLADSITSALSRRESLEIRSTLLTSAADVSDWKRIAEGPDTGADCEGAESRRPGDGRGRAGRESRPDHGAADRSVCRRAAVDGPV